MDSELRILHLTDIHINYMEKPAVTKQKWSSLIDRVLSVGAGLIDIVAVTGDICSHGEAREYRIALAYFNWFMKQCDIPKKKFVFCQGNHDADKTCANSTFQNYDKFLQDFYGMELYSKQQEIHSVNAWHFEKPIRIYSVNTNLTTSYIFYDNASISSLEAERIMEKVSADEYNILLMHHQPACIENETTFRNLCEKMDLVLCGHLHPNSPIINMEKKATIITGMAMTPHLSTIQKGCQLIEVTDDGVCVKPFFINYEKQKENRVKITI